MLFISGTEAKMTFTCHVYCHNCVLVLKKLVLSLVIFESDNGTLEKLTLPHFIHFQIIADF